MYTQEKPDINYLTHYGVLGMKWGVRKDNKRAERRAYVEKELGRKITKFDSPDPNKISNRDIKNIKRHDEFEKRYNKVKKKDDPGFQWLRGYDPQKGVSLGRRRVEKIVKELEKNPEKSAMKMYKIESGKKRAQNLVVNTAVMGVTVAALMKITS